MIQDRKSKKGAAAGLIFAAVVLVLVVLLENLSSLLPSVPAVLQPTSQLFTVLKKGAVYSLVAVSMNLLNGFTGLFSLGQAGFMLLGAYTYAILTVPVSAKDSVYYLYGGSAVPFSLPDLFGGVDTPAGLILGVLLAILLGGCVAALFAWLIGLPVLRLKSDYLAIATLGFAEIIRAVFQWQALGAGDKEVQAHQAAVPVQGDQTDKGHPQEEDAAQLHVPAKGLAQKVTAEQLHHDDSPASPQKNSALVTPLRRALALASSTAWGTTSAPMTCPARRARHREMVPMPQYRSSTVSSPVSPANSSASWYSRSV